MRKENKTLLKRILAAMLSVTLMSGAAVMTPIADFVGTNITASAAYDGYTEWTDTGIDADGNEAQVTCYWKIENNTLYIKGTIPNINGESSTGWRNSKTSIHSIYVEKDGGKKSRTSAKVNGLFAYCNQATSMDLSNLDTSAATSMAVMFNECMVLKSLVLSNDWKTDKVTDMSQMFRRNYALTSLDLSSWNTSKVTKMKEMFSQCSELKMLDLRGWDTHAVTDMSGMFGYCGKLETIYVDSNWNTDAVTKSNLMFSDCSSLVGSKKTSYHDDNPKNVTYGHIDGGEENPGYLSVKSYTVTWLNEDGAELGTTDVLYGETPVYDGNLPAFKKADGVKYVLTGWKDENDDV